MKKLTLIKVLFLISCTFFIPSVSSAATEFATFQSFYQESTYFPWMVAGIAAICAGAIIFFTGGTASPIVIGIGTWIGGLMGFTGIAATNAGLALLGGGSIATGGFGIIGGTVLLSASISFGTNVIVDYSLGKAITSYDYSRFADDSKHMATLPLPRNTSGPDSYKSGLKVLENAKSDQPISSDQNQAMIEAAIKTIESSPQEELSYEDSSRVQSLLALLYFQRNDYNNAKRFASPAYKNALKSKASATFPAFVYSASSLYDANPDFKQITKYFSYAIKNELDNPLTPILFSIYLDRVMYRYNDGKLSYSTLNSIYEISKPLPYDERKAIIQFGMLERYVMRIKLEQQVIISLTGTSTKRVKDSPKTLSTVKSALVKYKALLTSYKAAIDDQSTLLRMKLNRAPTALDRLQGGGIEVWERDWYKKVNQRQSLWSEYSRGEGNLVNLIRGLENYQSEVAKLNAEKAAADAAETAKASAEAKKSWGVKFLENIGFGN